MQMSRCECELHEYANRYVGSLRHRDAREFLATLLAFLDMHGATSPDRSTAAWARRDAAVDCSVPRVLTREMHEIVKKFRAAKHSWVVGACGFAVINSRTCKACGHKVVLYEPAFSLPLYVPEVAEERQVTLEDCIKTALGVHLHAGYKCTNAISGAVERCPGASADAEGDGDTMGDGKAEVCGQEAVEMASLFCRLGDTIVFALQRFQWAYAPVAGEAEPQLQVVRYDRTIDIPERVDLAPFCHAEGLEATGGGGTEYRLCAVCHHGGQPDGGHYWVTGKTLSDGKWREYDDAVVCETPPPVGPSKSAYMLFYTRI